ncbi:MAG: hypothetical protein KFW07_02445 [Mycoplasmataceae bacterium]|nr:hypothetical protein [Mycoplasmataceae bacterium]
MKNDDLLNEWRIAFKDDKTSLRKLAKLSNVDDDHPFFSKLFFDSKKIVSKIGLGYGKLNILTIKLIANSFANILLKKNVEKSHIDILVCSDGAIETKSFLKNISEVFSSKKIGITAFQSNVGYDKKFICRTVNKLELDAAIFIERSTYNDDIFNVRFIDNKGLDFEEEVIKLIKHEVEEYNVFEIKSTHAKIDYLSNSRVVNDYVEKILSLTSRKGDQRKIKIAVSDYNEGVTEILKKILGNMDFNYIINKNITNKISINQKSKRNEKTYINYFKKDIYFARKNKCGLLICPSKNGSELNLFVFNGRQVVYLDANEITLMFLNFFLIEMNIGNKKFKNFYIGTDIPPIKSIKNLINKYKLELIVSEDIKLPKDKYLLFYWNQNSQFIFGGNKITEFGFHHLMVRFLEMFNYYKTQRLNIVSQRNILIKMYGNYKTHVMILNHDLSELHSWLVNIKKSWMNEKYPISNIIMFENIKNFGENMIAKIILKNGVELFIKFNYLNRKVVIFVRIKGDDSKIWTKDYMVKNAYIKNLSSAIKKDIKKI